jgi:hypothetical protein
VRCFGCVVFLALGAKSGRPAAAAVCTASWISAIGRSPTSACDVPTCSVRWSGWFRYAAVRRPRSPHLMGRSASGVSMLFAVGLEPGWHTTIFPPYFVLGAVFEGFAVVLLISITLRHAFGLQHLVTDRHLDVLAKLLLALRPDDRLRLRLRRVRRVVFGRRVRAPHALQPQGWGLRLGLLERGHHPLRSRELWFRRVRLSAAALLTIAASVTVGMWLERFMLVESTLYRDFLPAAWQVYVPSFWEWSLFAGTVGTFLFLFFLFVRLLPMISTFELKELLHEERAGGHRAAPS